MKEIGSLRPCPFCGGEAEIDIASSTYKGAMRGWEFKVRCPKCGMTNNHFYKIEIGLDVKGEVFLLVDEREKAIDEWNRRASE